MSLKNLMLKRRSVRTYQAEPVSDREIDMIVQAGTFAPSSRNIRPVEFICIKDPETLKQLSLSKSAGAAFVKNASCCIVPVTDCRKSDVWIEDTSVALAYMMLACEENNLGCCWIQIRERKTADGRNSDEFVKELLSVPENYGIAGMLAVGYKKAENIPHQEEDFSSSVIHRERF